MFSVMQWLGRSGVQTWCHQLTEEISPVTKCMSDIKCAGLDVLPGLTRCVSDVVEPGHSDDK